MATKTWKELPGGRITRWKDRQHSSPSDWRERGAYGTFLKQKETRRLRREVRRLLAQGKYDDLPDRMPLHWTEWMLH